MTSQSPTNKALCRIHVDFDVIITGDGWLLLTGCRALRSVADVIEVVDRHGGVRVKVIVLVRLVNVECVLKIVHTN